MQQLLPWTPLHPGRGAEGGLGVNWGSEGLLNLGLCAGPAAELCSLLPCRGDGGVVESLCPWREPSTGLG